MIKANAVFIHHPQRLLEGLLEASANSHHLTDALHGAANLGGDPEELAEVPARHLDHTVVQTGLKVGRCRVGDRVPRENTFTAKFDKTAILRFYRSVFISAVIHKVRDSLEQRQRDPQAEFSCDIGQRITRRLAGQRRTARQTSVHLDDVILQSVNAGAG